MSDEDAIMWDLEAGARPVRSTITVVVMLDTVPDPVGLAARVDRLTRRLPRFRDRVVPASLPGVPPGWAPDPDFDVARHLLWTEIVDAGDLGGVLRRAETVATSPLRPGRPPWEIRLLQSGDRAALTLKFHHSFTDGVGLVRLAGELFDFERTLPAGPALDEPPRASEPPGRSSDIWDELDYEARQGARVVQAVVPWMAGALRDAFTDPQPRARQVIDAAQSVRALAASASRPGSPLLVGRSAGARLAALGLPLEEMRRAAKRAGGTVNDVFLAGTLDGLRRYHVKHGETPPSLRVGVPINTRDPESEAALGNHVAPMLVRMPLQLRDAGERIRLVHELIGEARRHPALGILGPATTLARRVPGLTAALKGLASSVDVLASNVPGSPVELYLAGARVERIIPVGPRGGSALNLTLLSHVDAVQIGVNMDPVAVPDPAVLVGCLEQGYDDTLG
jgi:WS/DGAT/MGAT family acyltransferase